MNRKTVLKIISGVIIVGFLLGGIAEYFRKPAESTERNYGEGMVEYSSSLNLTAMLDVYAQDIAAKPISPYLFGEFTEHLLNIYNGIWAQILENPGFEVSYFFGVIGNVDNEEVAYGWKKYGSGDVAYSVIPDSVGPGTTQKIEVLSLETSQVGIRQLIYLPFHREDEYELSLWLKGEAERLIVTVETIKGNVIGKVTFEGIELEWSKHTTRFAISTGELDRGERLVFTLSLEKPGTVMVDNCFLFPADNEEGFDPDVVRLVREANVTIIRWPGGNFASQYHWKDGVGPVDSRPTRLNKAWNIVEYNHVGTDEFMTFCKSVGAEPLTCVNAGDGTPEEAAQWVEYCNGDTNTTYGRLRAENGHPEPYNVKYWEIGNELFGSWQTGYTNAEGYAERYKRFHDTMFKVDPNIKFIANGWKWDDWDRILIERNGETVRSISRHYLPWIESTYDYLDLMAYAYWLRGDFRGLRDEYAKNLTQPKIAITELQGCKDLVISTYLMEALFYSGIINTAINLQGFVEIITHSALMGFGGGLRKERELVYCTPAFYALKIYATQPGKWSVKVKIVTPTYSVPRNVRVSLPAVNDIPYLDAVALLNDNKDILSLIVTNFHPNNTIEAKIRLNHFDAQETVKISTLTASSLTSGNSWVKPESVNVVDNKITITGNELDYDFPPHSITLFLFGARSLIS